MNRRSFVRRSLFAAAALGIRSRLYAAEIQSPQLRKFVQPLPGLGAGIPVASPIADPVLGSGWDYYNLRAGQYSQVLHPDLGPTTLWGYAETGGNFAHLGPVI